MAGARPCVHERDSEGQVSLADLSWAVGKTQAKSPTSTNKLGSFSNSQGSRLETNAFPSGESGPAGGMCG